MKRIFITGISGYIGSHCAAQLLQKDYWVKGSLRDMAYAPQIQNALNKVVNKDCNIDFYPLDLLRDDGWEEALEGCDTVLHVASPFEISEPKNPDDMIKPALDGTKRVLSISKKMGIKKVILTSSLVAMVGDKKVAHLTDKSWTKPDTDRVSSYMKSKAYAEKWAWDFYTKQSNDDKMQLTVINPGPVYGPPIINRIDGASMSFFAEVMTGKMAQLPPCEYAMSDVRDIAKIHVEAINNSQSDGKRLIVTTDEAHSFLDIGKLLSTHGFLKKAPTQAPIFLLKLLGLFNREIKGMMPFIGSRITADNSITKHIFNWEPIPFEKMVLDTAESLTKHLHQ
ncbi:MAG: NAD-dependent epimerase/dehydratase family protein [bacterium]